jgi:hypothetical protein
MQLLPGNTGTYSGVHTNDVMLFTQSDYINTDNADISGNPFWNENWKTAILYTDDLAILVSKVRLNLFKNDVYYTAPDGRVMIAKHGLVKGIAFFSDNDTTSPLANFVYLKSEGDKINRYYEVMNLGKAQLVKLNSVTLNKKPFDAFTGKSDLNYVTNTAYYLYYNSNMTLLKGQYKEAIFSILKPGNSVNEWLNKNNNKLKSSSDIIDFLEHFNDQAGK